MKIQEIFSYDDLLLKPKYSEISSRSKVDTSVKLKCGTYSHPIIPANMKTIIGERMINAIIQSNGLAIMHRFMPLEEQLSLAIKFNNGALGESNLGFSIGVKDDDKEVVKKFYDVGTRILCIDIAHGDSKACVDMIKWMKDTYPEIYVIAGNVATGSGAVRLWKAGTDMVKIGVGSGSICTTRVETGNGIAQLSALMDVFEKRQEEFGDNAGNYPFIADGGIRTAGDVSKALCFADMVMIGNMFAGCVETPGEALLLGNKTVKSYVGSSTHKTAHVEGVVALVPTKGKFEDILLKITDGVTSCCSYQGVDNLTDLKESPEFVKITAAGLKESLPHDVILT